MPHWVFWIVDVAAFIVLAFFLEQYRSVWYLKHHAVVAIIGIALGGAIVIAMMAGSNDLPLHLEPRALIWWAVLQTWILLGLAATVILIWDEWFFGRSRTSKQLDEMKQQLDDLRKENERLAGLYQKALGELQGRG